MIGATTTGPRVHDDRIVFTLEDESRRYAAVRLQQEVERPRSGPGFTYRPDLGAWTLEFERPEADRMEYRFELVTESGDSLSVEDPANPLTAPGPFGDRSVIEFPGYGPPPWVARDPGQRGGFQALELSSRILNAAFQCVLWTSDPDDSGGEMPLLVVHDGPELDSFSALTRYLAFTVAGGDVPSMRAALLAPVDRNETYSASALYSRVLTTEVLPQLAEHAPAPPGRRMRIGMGASLGALAMLHAHRKYPASFGGLFLQAGSFFRQRYDRYESNFPRFRRIARFVGTVLAADHWAHPIPVEMTCGAAEENLRNNLAVLEALKGQSYDVSFTLVRDAHNWIAWRDSFDPGLGRLLSRVWT